MPHPRLSSRTFCSGFYQVHQDIGSTTEPSDNTCPTSLHQWNQRLQLPFISCAQAYISLFAPSSQILPASRQARQICHFSEEYSPLCWAAASGQVSLFRCSSHLSSEYPSLFILCFLHARRSPHPAEAGLHLCRQI